MIADIKSIPLKFILQILHEFRGPDPLNFYVPQTLFSAISEIKAYVYFTSFFTLPFITSVTFFWINFHQINIPMVTVNLKKCFTLLKQFHPISIGILYIGSTPVK